MIKNLDTGEIQDLREINFDFKPLQRENSWNDFWKDYNENIEKLWDFSELG